MSETYDGVPRAEWLEGLREMRPWNIKHLLATFAYYGVPETFLDVGCGDGITIQTARSLGVRAYGVDQLVADDWPEYFQHVNLVNAYTVPERCAIVQCLEVAEHIHESAHGTFMDALIANLAEKDAKLIFSAAHPGQDGTGHVATRPAFYWRTELTARGLTYSRMDSLNLALLWERIQSPLGHLATNLQVFER